MNNYDWDNDPSTELLGEIYNDYYYTCKRLKDKKKHNKENNDEEVDRKENNDENFKVLGPNRIVKRIDPYANLYAILTEEREVLFFVPKKAFRENCYEEKVDSSEFIDLISLKDVNKNVKVFLSGKNKQHIILVLN